MDKLRCLVVDDDSTKCRRLRDALELEVGETGLEFRVVGSAYEAAAALRSTYFELMIVDLNLPYRPGEGPVADGGIRLLKQVGRGTAGIRRPLCIVGLTAYTELAESALSEFHRHGWALIEYAHDSVGWEEAIVNQCKHILDCRSQMDVQRTTRPADVCLITALHNVELEAVMDLPLGFRSFADPGDETRYAEGAIEANGQMLRVVACAAIEMGNPAAAIVATKVIAKFRPKVCFMVGICAGIDAEVGDIAVGEFSLHYESGKWKQDGGGESVFAPSPRYQSASARILEAVRRFNVDHLEQVHGLPAHWRGSKTGRTPQVKIGPVASGAAVVEDQRLVDRLLFRDRKLVALEMESYGFYLAAGHTSAPKSEFLMVKGVCDKASPPKSDEFQTYAAYMSAHYVYRFIKTEMNVEAGLFG